MPYSLRDRQSTVTPHQMSSTPSVAAETDGEDTVFRDAEGEVKLPKFDEIVHAKTGETEVEVGEFDKIVAELTAVGLRNEREEEERLLHSAAVKVEEKKKKRGRPKKTEIDRLRETMHDKEESLKKEIAEKEKERDLN